MRIRFGIAPFSLNWKSHIFSLQFLVLQLHWGGADRDYGFGISIFSEDMMDRVCTILRFSFYGLKKDIVIKTKLEDHYVRCSKCGKPIESYSLFYHEEDSPECDDYEAIHVYRKPWLYMDDILDMWVAGYKVEDEASHD